MLFYRKTAIFTIYTGLGQHTEHPAASEMRAFILFGIVIWISLFSPCGYGDTLVPSDAYRESSRCILDGRYSDAERVLDRFIADHPEEPAGYLLKAAALHYRAVDYEDFSRAGEFRKLLDRAESLALGKSAANPGDLWAKFFLHSARTFRGAWETANGSLVRGMMLGRSGAGGMARIIETDPRFYDAFLGDGSYRFWKSSAAKGMRLGPLVGDERSRGIREVREAIERGTLTGPLSRTVLLEMLLAYDPAVAARDGSELVRSYPRCRLFAWQLGEAYKKLGDFEAASGVFTALAERYVKDPEDDGSGQVRCWWKLAVLADERGMKKECGKYCERILALGERETVRARQAKRLEGARKMLAEIQRERN